MKIRNWWNIAKMIFSVYWMVQSVLLTLSLIGFLAVTPFLPVLGIAIEPIWASLAVIILPISYAISLKLLAWHDAGWAELGIKLNFRKKFIWLRNKITNQLPRWLGIMINWVT